MASGPAPATPSGVGTGRGLLPGVGVFGLGLVEGADPVGLGATVVSLALVDGISDEASFLAPESSEHAQGSIEAPKVAATRDVRRESEPRRASERIMAKPQFPRR